MRIAFHTSQYGRSIEINNNFRRKKLHRMTRGSNFFVDRAPSLIWKRKIVPVS